MSPETTPVLNGSKVSNAELESEFNTRVTAPEDAEVTQPDSPESQSTLVAPEPPSSEPEPPKFSNRWWIWGLLLLAGLGGAGWLVYTRVIMPMFSAGGPAFGPMPVALAQPTTARVQDSADYIATLDSRGAVTVRPQATGRISQILVRSGDRVQAGTPLLRLDAEQQQAQVSGSQANIDAANAEIVAAQADLSSARQTLTALQSTLTLRESDLTFRQQEYDRFKTLQAQGAATLQSLQQRKSELDQAQASISEMKAQINSQEAAIARAQADVVRTRQQKDAAVAAANQDQVQLSYFTVNAPIDGIVGDIPAKVGDLVDVSNELLTLTRNQALEVKIEVPQEKAGDLTTGTPVQLLDANNKVLKNGAVSYIAPNVSPQTQSVQVKAQFDNSSGQLRTNQLIKARLIWSTRQGVLVPTTAISRLAGKNFVFVAQPYDAANCSEQGPAPDDPKQWVAVQKPVELGPIIDNSQEIAQGLTVSDRVITSGLLQLQNCMPIQPNP